jgi:putative serine protease PepD
MAVTKEGTTMWDPPSTEDETPWPSAAVARPVERSPFSMTPPPASRPPAPPPVMGTDATLLDVTAVAPPPVANRALGGAPRSTAFVPPSLTAPPTVEFTQPKQRRRWPLVLLALFTIATSGLVSWAVATSVNDSDAAVTTPSGIAAGSAQQAVEDTATPTAPAPVRNTGATAADLAGEPFARAAEAIRPSVVQLNLESSLGTGVIINENGTILTAAHVVGTETAVRVTFSDGSSVDGEVVGIHTTTDVAVVKVDPAGRSLVAAPLANGDDVRVGQIAVAVGSPFGFDQTVTAGIISAVDRIVNGVSMVQTDAPINPGNSGGPLINLDGEVVGINDLIFTESGSSAGVGFAISIDLAVIVADQIIAGVEPQLALLGVSTGPPPNGASGAQVGEVVSGSAASRAGLRVGDIVVGVNGVATRGSGDLRAQVIDNPPGSSITLSILRDGEQLEISAVLGETGVSN